MTIMGGPLDRISKSVAITSGNGLTTDIMSTYLNGYLESVYVRNDGTASGANVNVVLSISTSTTITLLKVIDPSTLGERFYPRVPTVTTTEALLGATSNNANAYTRIPLVNERIKIGITTTSDIMTGDTWDIAVNIAKA